MTCKELILAALLAAASSVQACADVVISSGTTQNMTCSNGICAPTADNAVLNVDDLESLLASGNVEVTTNVGHHIKARDIVIEKSLTSSSSNTLSFESGEVTVRKAASIQSSGTLSFDAKQILIAGHVSVSGTGGITAIATKMMIDRPISIQGSGAVEIYAYSDLSFEQKGRLTFANTSSSVTINNVQYTLENSLPALAAAIAANPQGNFALANSYDARGDGTYGASPIPTNFLGFLEGLGNTISNISVNNMTACCVGGLFQSLSQGSVADIRLANVNVSSVQGAAGLAYESFASITGASVSGSVSGGGTGDIAGLVADNYGAIQRSYSTAAVSSGATVNGVEVGGLVGLDYGSTEDSFATGSVTVGSGSGNVGGLTGEEANARSGGDAENCYAIGNVSAGSGLNVGGLIGITDFTNYESTISCYSMGAVSGGTGSTVGGLIGVNNSFTSDNYWDTTTSGTGTGVGLGNASGVTGLTSTQLQSGLPAGLQAGAWHENAHINNGFPYLKDNPPPD